jgi:hypothetical protein
MKVGNNYWKKPSSFNNYVNYWIYNKYLADYRIGWYCVYTSGKLEFYSPEVYTDNSSQKIDESNIMSARRLFYDYFGTEKW